MMGLRRLHLFIFALAAVAGAGLGAWYNHARSFGEVSFKIPAGEHVLVYKDAGDDSPFNVGSAGTPVATAGPNETTKLSWGTYAAVVEDPDNTYVSPVKKFVVNRSVLAVEPTLTLSEKSRAQALSRERGAAKAVLQSRYLLSQRGYVISADGLFGAAEWYGCVIKPQNASQDTLRAILQKKNGEWGVAAKPAITIGAPSHPDIPFEVLRQVNGL